MKLKKTARYLVFQINLDSGEIELIKKQERGASDGKEEYETFIGENLPENEGRYAVYDFHYNTADGRPQDKLTFITWYVDFL